MMAQASLHLGVRCLCVRHCISYHLSVAILQTDTVIPSPSSNHTVVNARGPVLDGTSATVSSSARVARSRQPSTSSLPLSRSRAVPVPPPSSRIHAVSGSSSNFSSSDVEGTEEQSVVYEVMEEEEESDGSPSRSIEATTKTRDRRAVGVRQTGTVVPQSLSFYTSGNLRMMIPSALTSPVITYSDSNIQGSILVNSIVALSQSSNQLIR